MNALFRLRSIHAVVAVLATAAYLTGEAESVHAWLGYGVVAALLLRLVLALSGAPQLGLFRFYPYFEGLRLGNLTTHPAISRTLLLAIALCLTVAGSTGILLDRGHALGLAATGVIPTALADEGEDDALLPDRRSDDREDHGPVGEIHETAGNLLALCVGLHVAYLLAFKRPLALFMLFLRSPRPHGRRSQS